MTKKLTIKQKLEKVEELLFPKLEIRTLTEDDKSVRVLVDTSVISNLYSCLHELRENKNDEVIWASIENVLTKLQEIKDLLEPDVIPDENMDDINYMIVDFR